MIFACTTDELRSSWVWRAVGWSFSKCPSDPAKSINYASTNVSSLLQEAACLFWGELLYGRQVVPIDALLLFFFVAATANTVLWSRGFVDSRTPAVVAGLGFRGTRRRKMETTVAVVAGFRFSWRGMKTMRNRLLSRAGTRT